MKVLPSFYVEKMWKLASATRSKSNKCGNYLYLLCLLRVPLPF